MSGGERNADDEVVRETLDTAGAVLMGRRMFSGGEGPWEDDPVADGWWGDDPPFRAPVFVLTHHPRETVTKQGGTSFIFVTDGLESALAQAREAAGDKDVVVAGGANVVQQCLNSGHLDQMQIHLVPAFLGEGVRLFDQLRDSRRVLEVERAIHSPCRDPHQIPPCEVTTRLEDSRDDGQGQSCQRHDGPNQMTPKPLCFQPLELRRALCRPGCDQPPLDRDQPCS
jgi:dihydrofolate reductase